MGSPRSAHSARSSAQTASAECGDRRAICPRWRCRRISRSDDGPASAVAASTTSTANHQATKAATKPSAAMKNPTAISGSQPTTASTLDTGWATTSGGACRTSTLPSGLASGSGDSVGPAGVGEGGRAEGEPALLLPEVRLDPGVRVLRADRLVVVPVGVDLDAGGEADRDPRGDVRDPQHHGHRRGVLLAEPALALEHEVGQRVLVGRRGRAGVVDEPVLAGEVAPDRVRLVEVVGGTADELVGQARHAMVDPFERRV